MVATIGISYPTQPTSLNIKNEETFRLARKLARLTGETMTAAVTVALRESKIQHRT